MNVYHPISPKALLISLCLFWLPSVALAAPYFDSFSANRNSIQGAGDAVTLTYDICLSNGDRNNSYNVNLVFSYGDTTSTSVLYQLNTKTERVGGRSCQRGTFSFNAPKSVLFGDRYWHASATARINDNTRTANTYTPVKVLARPNLQISVLSVAPSSQVPGGNLYATYRINNVGLSRADNFTARFYYGTSANISTSDTAVGPPLYVTELYAQTALPQSQNGVATVPLPSSITNGSYYLGLIADFQDVVKESSENDNMRSTPFTVAVPDLAMNTWSAPSSSTGVGQTFSITFRVANLRPGNASSFKVSFYYGDSTATTNLTFLNSSTVNSLNGNTITPTLTLSVTMPKTVLGGARYLHYFIDSDDQVGEASETNNRGHRPITITGKPNLKFSAFSVNPSSQSPGATLTITYRVTNDGNVRSPAGTKVRFYFSNDSTISTADTYLNQEVTLPALDVGAFHPDAQSGLISVSVPSTAIGGLRYVGGYADYNGTVIESNEGDNTARASFTVSGKPDLVMNTWSASPTARGAGSTVTVNFRVENRGTATAGAFNIAFYYGDTGAPTNLTLLGEKTYTSLKASTVAPQDTISLTLPNTVLSGDRAIQYFIDYKSVVDETDETNNRGEQTITITGKPNLQVILLSVNPTTNAPGASISLSYRVKNVGYARASGPISLKFYYSADSTITASDFELTPCCATVPTLDAQALYPASQNGSLQTKLPSNILAGTRYVGAYIDDNQKVTEENEGDNTRTAPFTAIQADLSFGSWTVATSAEGFGKTLSTTFTIRNTGNANAGPFNVRFYYADNTSITGATTISTLTFTGLAKGATSSSRTVSLTLPNNVLYGKRYIHAFIDQGRAVGESDENNNLAYRAFNVTGRPNLQVSVLTLDPTSQTAGGSVKVTYRVKNAGLSRAGAPFRIGFYYSDDSTISTTDNYLNEQATINDLNAGDQSPTSQNGTVTVTLPFNIATGTRYIGAFVDDQSKVAEADEGDNTRAASFTTSAVDLLAKSVAATPAIAKPGATISLSFEFQNTGNRNNAASFTVRFFFSDNNTIDSQDTVLLDRTYSTLNAGASVKQQLNVNLPSSLGAVKGYIIMFVDAENTASESNENNNITTSTFQFVLDQDGDNVTSDKDCNDRNKLIYPGATEICNGLDDDCDGDIDESCTCNAGQTQHCYSGGVGCTRRSDGRYSCTLPCKSGIQTCSGGKWGACVGEATEQTELCDGLDNDCDGNVDENVTQPCYDGPASTDGVGTCKKGERKCLGKNLWGACQNQVVPQKEDCNGKDDDCNGKIDDVTRSCYGGPDGTLSRGECKQGQQQCQNGQWGTCTGEVTPKAEECDGKDNDCDGYVDNQPKIPAKIKRVCASSCEQGEETCIRGTWQGCTARPNCEVPPEPKPEPPPTDAGNPTEPPPTDSSDCYTQGCPSGQICQNDNCVTDPCNGITCNAGEVCRGGQCLTACGCLECRQGQRCLDGQCVNDPCASIQCNAGEVCDPNSQTCISDPCQGTSCGQGRVCKGGACTDDPCSHIQCPSGMRCDDGQCLGNNCSNEPQTEPQTEPPTEPTTQDDGEEAPPTSKENQTNEPTQDAGNNDAGPDSGFSDLIVGPGGDQNGNDTGPPVGCQCSSKTPSPTGLLWMLLFLFALPFVRNSTKKT